MLASLASYPAKALAEFLLNKFIGKFVERIDLNKEGTSFNKAEGTLKLPDLNLDCKVRAFSNVSHVIDRS